MYAKSLQSCLTFCCPMDYSPLLCPWNSPGKNTGVVCRTLPQGNLTDLGIESVSLMSPALAGAFLTTSTTWKPILIYISTFC